MQNTVERYEKITGIEINRNNSSSLWLVARKSVASPDPTAGLSVGPEEEKVRAAFLRVGHSPHPLPVVRKPSLHEM